MNRILFLTAMLAMVPISQLNASIVLFDNFSYPDGPLPAPWALHSGTGGQTIVSSQLSINDSGTGDYNRAFSSGVTSGTIFAGFDLSVSSSDLPSAPAGQYFAHFGQETTGTNTQFVSRVFLASGTNGSDFNIGIARGAGTGATTTFLSGTFLAGTTYRVVHGFDMATNTATLSVDSPDGSTSVTSNTGTTTPSSINFFAFRISGSADGDKTIDNLVVATTYSQAFTAVPEPTSMALLGCVMVGVAGLRFRRKLG